MAHPRAAPPRFGTAAAQSGRAAAQSGGAAAQYGWSAQLRTGQHLYSLFTGVLNTAYVHS
eukprot:242006-Chlamydomonas_euryale.AAC.7